MKATRTQSNDTRESERDDMSKTMTEAIRDFAETELEASKREAYILAHQTEVALRAAEAAIKELEALATKLRCENPDVALHALRTLAGHAGYSNTPTTAVAEVLSAASAVAGVLSTL